MLEKNIITLFTARQSLHWIKIKAHKGGWDGGDHTKCIWDTSKIEEKLSSPKQSLKCSTPITAIIWSISVPHHCNYHFQTFFKLEQVVHSLSKKLAHELYIYIFMFLTAKPFLFMNVIFHIETFLNDQLHWYNWWNVTFQTLTKHRPGVSKLFL